MWQNIKQYNLSIANGCCARCLGSALLLNKKTLYCTTIFHHLSVIFFCDLILGALYSPFSVRIYDSSLGIVQLIFHNSALDHGTYKMNGCVDWEHFLSQNMQNKSILLSINVYINSAASHFNHESCIIHLNIATMCVCCFFITLWRNEH